VRFAVYLERCASHLDLDSWTVLPRASLLLSGRVKKEEWNFRRGVGPKARKSSPRVCDG
jgi:hypothetical protein